MNKIKAITIIAFLLTITNQVKAQDTKEEKFNPL